MMKKYILTPEKRAAKRLKRMELWQKPLTSRGHILRAWVNMIFVDHAIFRAVYLNQHRITDTMYRAAQPMPHHIRRWKNQGIKTIINLRGGRDYGSWPLQKQACEQQGLNLEELILRSRDAPAKETILQAAALFDRIAYPAVMHCKSGADRAGFASALFMLIRENATPQQAMRQLSLRFGHFKNSKTGILDAFVEAYAKAHADSGIAFLDWVQNEYDRDAVMQNFKTRGLSRWFVDSILRRE
jgi:protein tyrosine phosphatase (PTP) superfamily phosphohydrolase (DUF442 family)